MFIEYFKKFKLNKKKNRQKKLDIKYSLMKFRIKEWGLILYNTKMKCSLLPFNILIISVFFFIKYNYNFPRIASKRNTKLNFLSSSSHHHLFFLFILIFFCVVCSCKNYLYKNCVISLSNRENQNKKTELIFPTVSSIKL